MFAKSLSRLVIMATVFPSLAVTAQTADVTGALQWRQIGPFRGGWSTIALGIAEQPDTFYFGAAGGGVWKSEDAGSTWHSVGGSGDPIDASPAEQTKRAQILYNRTGPSSWPVCGRRL